MKNQAFEQTIATACTNARKILEHNLQEFGHGFHETVSERNFYAKTENTGDWTTGFFTGEYWLAFEQTGDVRFKEAALAQVDTFLERIQKRFVVDHHDMGFLFTPSCVAAYKLAGSETGKKAALLAADNLISRFQEKGQFIQAWGELGAVDNYRLIIDCLLNLPLLYWASDVTGDPKYREKALAHTKTSLKTLVRPDNSTYHTYFFDLNTGAPSRGVTHQGYKDDSAWARGQAWGIYGLALSYRHTKDPTCIDLFYRVTDYFLSRMPANFVPYWDLTFMDGDEPRDSSASAIAACGMLEMASALPADKAEYYRGQAEKLTLALIEHCAVSDTAVSNGLLLHGVYGKSSPFNGIKNNNGVDECNAWGDYFYMELLTRLSLDWHPYW